MYFEFLQLILIIPKTIESLLFLFNIILANQKNPQMDWKERSLVARLYCIGMGGWVVYITLDIFIFYLAPVSMALASEGRYLGYRTGYVSLTLANIMRDVAFTGALVQLWFYLFASLSVHFGETKTIQLMKNPLFRIIILGISLVILIFDQIKVDITADGPIINPELQGLGGLVIALFVLIYFASVIFLMVSLRSESKFYHSNKIKTHIFALILGVFVMGVGNLYWLFLGILEGTGPHLFIETSNRFLFTFAGHFIWMLSPIFIYFGFRKPIEVSPKIDADYSKLGKRIFRKLVDEKFLGMFLIKNNKIIYGNPLMEKIFGFQLKDITPWQLDDLLTYIHPEDLSRVKLFFYFHKNSTESSSYYEFRYLSKTKDTIWVEQISIPILSYDESVLQIIFRDITERKNFEKEKKTLQGLLPICAKCKKIRDDEGYYIQLEQYIHTHSEAQFTHGYCPECMEDMLAEIEDVEKDH